MRWLRSLTACACWASLAIVLMVWLLMRFASDRWWPATVLIFGPRWIWAVPALLSVPFAAALRRRMLWVLAAALVVAFGPVMGLCLSWPSREPAHADALIRVLTCNIDEGHGDVVALFKLIESSRSDIVALQECGNQVNGLSAVMGQIGWHVRSDGGLFLASKYPIVSADHLTGERPWLCIAANYEIQTPAGPLQFINLHLMTPRPGLYAVEHHSRHMAREMDEITVWRQHDSQAVAARAALLSKSPGGARLLIAGDFNLPVESAIYRTYWSSYTDAWGTAGMGYGNTKMQRLWSARIDHILSGPGWRVRDCTVGPDVQSDHLPVIATLEWTPSP